MTLITKLKRSTPSRCGALQFCDDEACDEASCDARALSKLLRALASQEASSFQTIRYYRGVTTLRVKLEPPLTPVKILYTGQKRFFLSPTQCQQKLAPRSYNTCTKTNTILGSKPPITCFNIMQTACRVSTCTFPLEEKRVTKNFKDW